jgi:hypothetical protein
MEIGGNENSRTETNKCRKEDMKEHLKMHYRNNYKIQRN